MIHLMKTARLKVDNHAYPPNAGKPMPDSDFVVGGQGQDYTMNQASYDLGGWCRTGFVG
jgi:hypothetical protein